MAELQRGIFVGDSIIKYATGQCLAVPGTRTTTFSWPGAAVKVLDRKLISIDWSMVDFVIVHIGTNDLASAKPSALADQILVGCLLSVEMKEPHAMV